MRDSGQDPFGLPQTLTSQVVASWQLIHNSLSLDKNSEAIFRDMFYFLVLCDFFGILDINKDFLFKFRNNQYGWRFVFSAAQPRVAI